MNHNAIETILGAVVLIVAGIFLVFALGAADMKRITGYNVSANFSKADGISPGLDVRISGVKIGSVTQMDLDPQTFLAKVTMSVKPEVKLPLDTVAKISSEGLLGGKYLALEPGAEEENIPENGRIQYTQSSLNLEEMIGKFIFSSAEKGADDKGNSAESDSSADPLSEAY